MSVVSEAMSLTLRGDLEKMNTTGGCAQSTPLIGGMSSPFISNHLITYSSIYGNSPSYGRDNTWRSRIDSTGEHGLALNAGKTQWVQWDLLKKKTITKMELKGGSLNGWYITKFKLKHSDD